MLSRNPLIGLMIVSVQSHSPDRLHPLLVLHHRRGQTLWILDIDCLHVAVELLLSPLLVISPP